MFAPGVDVVQWDSFNNGNETGPWVADDTVETDDGVISALYRESETQVDAPHHCGGMSLLITSRRGTILNGNSLVKDKLSGTLLKSNEC